MRPQALVTGGATGIGRAVARRLAADGFDVVATSHRTAPPTEADPALAAGITDVAVDVTDATAVEAVVAEAIDPARIAVLVCCTAAVHDHLLPRTTDADLTATLDADLVAAARWIRLLAAPMRRRRHGRIVLVSSVVGSTGMPAQTAYAATKAGLVGLARSAAHELGTRGITVNVVAPGPIDTPMLAEVTDAQRAGWVGRVPLGRVGSADEVAATIAWLASDQASFTTGALVPVDGGLLGVGPWVP